MITLLPPNPKQHNQPGRTLLDMSTLGLLCNAKTQSYQELRLGGVGQHSYPAAGNSTENFLQYTKYFHERKVNNLMAPQTTRQYFLILQPHSTRTPAPEHFSCTAKPLCNFGNKSSFRYAFTRLTQCQQVPFYLYVQSNTKDMMSEFQKPFHNNENPH